MHIKRKLPQITLSDETTQILESKIPEVIRTNDDKRTFTDSMDITTVHRTLKETQKNIVSTPSKIEHVKYSSFCSDSPSVCFGSNMGSNFDELQQTNNYCLKGEDCLQIGLNQSESTKGAYDRQ